MSFQIDDEKPLEKNKPVWTKIESLKNIELDALSTYDDRYIKAKKKKEHVAIEFMTNFHDSNGQKMISNMNLLQSVLLILYLHTKTNCTCKCI